VGFVPRKKDDLAERLMDCLVELENLNDELDLWDAAWIDSIEELSEIGDAFEVEERNKLKGKTILEIGTDCVKPLYIALKFEPDKIIGISEDLSEYSFASDLERKSNLLTKTQIKLYSCSFFDEEKLGKILAKEKQTTSNFVLVSKTLHHLRSGECIAKERDKEHKHQKDEKCCIYKFQERQIFKRLIELGKRVIIYEAFYPDEEDEDKVRGRGGYFTMEEWKRIFKYLSQNYTVEFIEPLRFHLHKEDLGKVTAKLREVDRICFYIETK